MTLGGTVAVVLAGCTAIGRMLAVGVVRLGVAGPGWGVASCEGPLGPAPAMGRMLAVGVRPDWSPAQSGTAAGLACCCEPTGHGRSGEGRGGRGRSARIRTRWGGTAYYIERA